MKRIKTLISLVLMIILCLESIIIETNRNAQAESNPIFIGNTYSSDNTPLSGVNVTVFESSSYTNEASPLYTTDTDSSGKWEIDDLNYNVSYTLVFMKSGYTFSPSKMEIAEMDTAATKTRCDDVVGQIAIEEPVPTEVIIAETPSVTSPVEPQATETENMVVSESDTMGSGDVGEASPCPTETANVRFAEYPEEETTEPIAAGLPVDDQDTEQHDESDSDDQSSRDITEAFASPIAPPENIDNGHDSGGSSSLDELNEYIDVESSANNTPSQDVVIPFTDEPTPSEMALASDTDLPGDSAVTDNATVPPTYDQPVTSSLDLMDQIEGTNTEPENTPVDETFSKTDSSGVSAIADEVTVPPTYDQTEISSLGLIDQIDETNIEPENTPIEETSPTVTQIPEVQKSISILIDPVYAKPGDVVTLTATMVGYEGASLQWQWATIPQNAVGEILSAKGAEKSPITSGDLTIAANDSTELDWNNEPGATDPIYQFMGSTENLNRYWRIILWLPEMTETPGNPKSMCSRPDRPILAFIGSLILAEAKAEGGALIVSDGHASLMAPSVSDSVTATEDPLTLFSEWVQAHAVLQGTPVYSSPDDTHDPIGTLSTDEILTVFSANQTWASIDAATVGACYVRLEYIDIMGDTTQGAPTVSGEPAYPLTLADFQSRASVAVTAETETNTALSGRIMPSISLMSSSVPSYLNPQTLVITSDNEDNVHSGQPDHDLNDWLFSDDSISPIEVRFTINKLPARSAHLAIHAWDCDENNGSQPEYDSVYVNGTKVGVMTGEDEEWNTTLISVPVDCLKIGANYVTVHMGKKNLSTGVIYEDYHSWAIEVKWVQLLLDGGDSGTALESFTVELQKAELSGSDVHCQVHASIVSDTQRKYIIEYSLVDNTSPASSTYLQIISADSSTVSGTSVEDDGTLKLSLNAVTGEYLVQVLLKNADTEEILAADESAFEFTAGVVPSFDISQFIVAQNTDEFTSGPVTLNLSAQVNDPLNQIDNVCFFIDNQAVSTTLSASKKATGQTSVAKNGKYLLEIRYTKNGGSYNALLYHTVDNIQEIRDSIYLEINNACINNYLNNESNVQVYSYQEQTIKAKVVSTGAWKAATQFGVFDQTGWVSCPSSGAGTQDIQIKLQRFPPFQSGSRYGFITFTTGSATYTFALKQSPENYALSVDKTTLSVPALKSMEKVCQVVSITANDTWTYSVNTNWLNIQPSTTSLMIYVAKDNRSFSSRSCTITVTCGSLVKTVNVTQKALEKGIYIWDSKYNSVIDKTLEFSNNDTGRQQTVKVLSPSDWSAAVDGSGYNISPKSGKANKVTNVTISLQANAKATATKFTVSYPYWVLWTKKESVSLKQKKQYTISYDANGGSGAPASQVKDPGVSNTISSQVPTYYGYNFSGWMKNKDPSQIYKGGDEYSDDADLVLYANWTTAISSSTIPMYSPLVVEYATQDVRTGAIRFVTQREPSLGSWQNMKWKKPSNPNWIDTMWTGYVDNAGSGCTVSDWSMLMSALGIDMKPYQIAALNNATNPMYCYPNRYKTEMAVQLGLSKEQVVIDDHDDSNTQAQLENYLDEYLADHINDPKHYSPPMVRVPTTNLKTHTVVVLGKVEKGIYQIVDSSCYNCTRLETGDKIKFKWDGKSSLLASKLQQVTRIHLSN